MSGDCLVELGCRQTLRIALELCFETHQLQRLWAEN